jgi:hypothetical protein
MKKIFLFLFLSLLANGFIMAQSFSGGLLAGVVASQVDGDNFSGYNKAGFIGGGYVNLTIREKWAIQMEMEFIMKGSHASDSMNNVYLLNTNYIEVPIMLHYNFYKKYIVQFGLSSATLISHKETLNDQDMSPYYPKLKKQNVSLIVGLRYPINDKLTFDFRAGNSIQSIRSGTMSGYINRFGKYGQYHNLMVLGLSYKI